MLDEKSNKYSVNNLKKGNIIRFLKKFLKSFAKSSSHSHRNFAMTWFEGRSK